MADRSVTSSHPGSSPLTRGKPVELRATRHRERLIPAHAGKTRIDTEPQVGSEAHPRSRGENWSGVWTGIQTMGSSPLTRGKLAGITPRQCADGLIPAHAGKTSLASIIFGANGAHPRSRGENLRPAGAGRGVEGSSPLTRGKRLGGLMYRVDPGLIPAHAGKTRVRRCRPGRNAAHPRSRGENWSLHSTQPTPGGSSPLTRGKHFPTCAFTAQIDQILETLELAVSSGSYSVWVACATDAPQDQVRSIGLVLPSSRGAS